MTHLRAGVEGGLGVGVRVVGWREALWGKKEVETTSLPVKARRGDACCEYAPGAGEVLLVRLIKKVFGLALRGDTIVGGCGLRSRAGTRQNS